MKNEVDSKDNKYEIQIWDEKIKEREKKIENNKIKVKKKKLFWLIQIVIKKG